MTKNKQTKKISINALDNIMKESNEQYITAEWCEENIIIKRTLSLTEMLSFVKSVVSLCFGDGDEYMPEVKDFLIKSFVLETYANFRLPTNMEHRYDLVYNTDAFDIVLEHINRTQFGEICNSIDEKIDNVIKANIETINNQINDIHQAFEDMQNKLGDLFSDIEADDINKLISAISDGGQFDEEKVVKAYMDDFKKSNEISKEDD